MTIVHLTPSYAPAKGGVETHVASVVALQLKAGHTVSVLTKSAPHTKLATWQFMMKHRGELLAADLIQVHDVFWWLLPIYPLLALHHKKIITTFHGWEGQYPVRWQAKIQRWVYNQLSTKSVHVGAWIQEFYWDKPDAVIYGGVDALVKKLPITVHQKSKLKLVFVGRLEAENDVKKYLAFVVVLKKEIDLEVTWVGDGQYKDECAAVGKVTGMVANVSEYLQAADIVLAASYLSMMEAQALGKLVVAFYSHPLKQRYLETFPGAAAMIVESSSEQAVLGVKKFLATKKTISVKVDSWQKVVDVYGDLANDFLVYCNQSMGMGGAEVFMTDLLVALQTKGWRIRAVTTNQQLVTKFEAANIRTQQVPWVMDVIGDWKGLVKAVVFGPLAAMQWWQVVSSRPSLLLLSGFNEKLLVTPLAHWFGVPVVWIEFSSLAPVLKKWAGLIGWWYRSLVLQVAKIITSSQHSQQKLINELSLTTEKIVIIPCGSAAKITKAKPKSNKNIICVSRLQPGKGQDVLLQAMPAILKKHSDVQLTIVGEGDFLPTLKKMTKDLGLAKNITFAGRVSDVTRELEQATICVFPSLWELEGFGLVLIEAMAAGVPIVTFDRGPLNEIIHEGKNGLLAKAGSADDLAEKINLLLDNSKLRAKLAHQAQLDFAKLYTIEHVAKTYAQHLADYYR